MTSASPGFLRLYREQSPIQVSEDATLWHELGRQFELATDRPLADSPPSENIETLPPRDQAARRLGLLVGQLWEELQRTREALWCAEADLATGVPMIADRGDAQHLAARLESILKGAALAIDCQASAMYVLDSGTTQLKLRSLWNLPRGRLADPARPLQGAVADLEALCGHAVVIEDANRDEYWCPPEICGAAVCVPISSANTVLGTVWIYSDEPRQFTDAEVNIIEIVSGRMAVELEREVLLAKRSETAKLEKQLELAAKIQEHQLPQIAPLVDAWQLAGFTEQQQILGGDFHDWLVRRDDQVSFVVGDCLDGGVDASLCAAAVRSAWRALVEDIPGPDRLMGRLNDHLFRGSAGDQYAHLFVGFAEPNSGKLRYSFAGCPGAIVVQRDDWRSLVLPSLSLGVDGERVFRASELDLLRGESLVVMTNGVLDALDGAGRPLDLDRLGQWLIKHPQASAGQLVDLVRDFLETHYTGPRYDDRTVLVVKRR